MSDSDLFTDTPSPDAGLFTDEPAPYFEDVIKNAGREVRALPGSIPTMAKDALGVASAPLDALKSIPEMVGGKKLSETSIAEDLAPIVSGNKGTVQTVEHPVDSFRAAPINTIGTALGLLGGVKGVMGEVGETVPRGTIPKEGPAAAEGVGETEKVAPTLPAAEAPTPAPEIPKGSPEVSPVKATIHETTGLPLNDDGTVTLYHGTTKKALAEIQQTGTLKSAGEPDIYLTTDPKGAGYGDGTVAKVRVNPDHLQLDDEFPDGRQDFRIDTGMPGGSYKPQSVEPSTPLPSPAAASLKDLPVVQPGSKAGEPHALFAYNDQYGPDGTTRSIYNIFGDPGNPRLTQAGGYGSSVTKDILDQAGIPVVGREPRSVGKWEPIEPEPIPSKTPPSEARLAQAAPAPPKPPTTGAQRLESAADEGLKQANELKDYVSRGYEGFAKKPGAIADVADWVQEKSQMMAAQQLGVTPNQARQLGKSPLASHNTMRAIGQYALDKEIVSPTTGLGGMLEKNNTLLKAAGKTLGDYREMADKLNPALDPKEVVAEVRKALDSKYMRVVKNAEGEESAPRGAYGGQAGAYLRALQEVEDAEKSHTGIAKAATELNHAANKAAKNMQPETPFTDVANEVSRINNAKIKALIGEENAAKYEQALREYGVNKKIANALKFKSSGEVKRFGPGSTLSNLAQKAMDELGYRVGAKTANKLSTAIKNNPSIAGSLPSIFKEFIHQVEDVNHDVSGLSQGGRVPDDVRHYVGC